MSLWRWVGIEWTNTASGGDTQLLNKVIELMRWEWDGVAESELHKGRQPVQVLYVDSVVHAT